MFLMLLGVGSSLASPKVIISNISAEDHPRICVEAQVVDTMVSPIKYYANLDSSVFTVWEKNRSHSGVLTNITNNQYPFDSRRIGFGNNIVLAIIVKRVNVLQ